MDFFNVLQLARSIFLGHQLQTVRLKIMKLQLKINNLALRKTEQ